MTDANARTGPKSDSAAEENAAARIAEYEALRAESDRSSQLLSNAIWIGVTGFGLTLAGAAAASTNGLEPAIVPAVALLLSIQSIAITTLYGSELWKYIRVGTYIRVYIEGYFRRHTMKHTGPMHWETWIVTHRATLLHMAALIFLQAPVAVTGALLAGTATGWIPSVGGASALYLGYLGTDRLLIWVLWLIVAGDIIMVVLLGYKLRCAQNGNFGDGGRSMKALADAAAEGGSQ